MNSHFAAGTVFPFVATVFAVLMRDDIEDQASGLKMLAGLVVGNRWAG